MNPINVFRIFCDEKMEIFQTVFIIEMMNLLLK